MAKFIDQDYLINAVGEQVANKVAPTDPIFDQFCEAASAEVQAAAEVAGYTLGESTTNAMVKRLTLAQLYVSALGYRSGVDVPPTIAADYEKLAKVRSGELPIPGLTPSTRDAVGGHTFSNSGSGGRSTRFSRSDLCEW